MLRLHRAASNGNTEEVGVLLAKGSEINSTSSLGEKTALFYAVENGHDHLIPLLLNAGANIDAVDKFGQTALICAIKKSHAEVAYTLIERGANLDVLDSYGKCALGCAVASDQHDVVRELVHAGCDVRQKFNRVYPHYNIASIYDLVVAKGYPTLIELFWLYGAELDLNGAAMIGNVEDTEALIAKGSDVNQIKGFSYIAPLMGAAFFGHISVMAVLCEHKVDVNLQSRSSTALCFAARGGQADAALYLIRKGAEINSSMDTPSALYQAAINNKSVTSNLLIKYGARIWLREAVALSDYQVLHQIVNSRFAFDSNIVYYAMRDAVAKGDSLSVNILLKKFRDVIGGTLGNDLLKIAKSKNFRYIHNLLTRHGVQGHDQVWEI